MSTPAAIAKYARVLRALLARPLTREQVDSIGKVSNGPDLIFRLRKCGFALPCERRAVPDPDGGVTHPGAYSMSARDRRMAREFLRMFDEQKARRASERA